MRIVYFDGHCNLCNGFVDFMIRRDQQGLYRFASLQGSTAAARLPAELREGLRSVVLEADGQFFVESTAAIRTLGGLGGVYSLAMVLLLIPRFLRDLFYRGIASSRYRIFGRRDTCRVPTPEDKNRLLG